MNQANLDVHDLNSIETQRLLLQQKLDMGKGSQERNKLGQFATPSQLSIELLKYAQTLIPKSEKIRFLDPAFGTGSFYSAFLRTFPCHQIERACGYEIDPHYGASATQFWSNQALDLRLTDFTKLSPPVLESDKFNLILCNPPYVRHHHLRQDDKTRLQHLVSLQTGYQLSGLTGLYCYFLLLSQCWMSANGVAGWLVPSEFLDVKYGHEVKRFLLNRVTLLHVHRFDPKQTQFEDALVSSVVVWFRNALPHPTHQTKFSFGGSLTTPEKSIFCPIAAIDSKTKWSWVQLHHSQNKSCATQTTQLKVSDLFSVKRGIATGANKFFILTAKQISDLKLPQESIRPILPSPRYLDVEEIETDQDGYPKIDKQRFLLDCHLPEAVIREKYPHLWNYLQTGIEQGIHNRYLCRHRSPWYAQESRSAAPILCSYMGRISQTHENPFRFILNHSEAIAPNVYLLLYPQPMLTTRLKSEPELLHSIWQMLKQIAPANLISEGRVYGGGLHKIEPNELANTKLIGFDKLAWDKFRPTTQLSFL